MKREGRAVRPVLQQHLLVVEEAGVDGCHQEVGVDASVFYADLIEAEGMEERRQGGGLERCSGIGD